MWDDPEAGQATLQRLARAREAIDPIQTIEARCREIVELAELAALEDNEDSAFEAQLQLDLDAARIDLDRFELDRLLSDEHDASNAIIEINAGAGGTEACDWVQMLLRMYLRWAQSRGFAVEMLNDTPGEVAGLKSVTFEVNGSHAYGYMKAERGVHRLVRISPFDSNKKRHTSFASVDVIPEVDEGEQIEIHPDDLRVDTYRSSGAGGQHVNKTDSAVRLTHLPSGLVVSCQNERSQHKNRASAMKVLISRLQELERLEADAKMSDLRGEKREIAWANQIRSYTFQPYTLIKDHRTGHETGDVIRTMDGAIDGFLHAYLKWHARKESD